MAHTHHPHRFSHESFGLHAKWVARLKGFGITLGIGALLAIAAVQVAKLELALNRPVAVDVAPDKTYVPVATASYLPDQFFEQEEQAKIEELRPQF